MNVGINAPVRKSFYRWSWNPLMMLSTVAELAFGKRSRSACVAFGWRSSTASMRAARTTAPIRLQATLYHDCNL